MTASTMNKLRVMTYLRDGIVAREDLARNILRLEDALGTDAEKVVVEALQAKSVEDGRNLLMHAAAYGFKRGFVALIEVMLKRSKHLGHLALVRQLRELDEDGAPLLFQATLSNSVRCLTVVLSVLEGILGVGGLDEQLHAIDHKGRNVLMYAVKSPSISVHMEIQKLLDHDRVRTRPFDLTQLDGCGRSLLHHAAESECPEVLREVLKLAKKHDALGKLSEADSKGRTPIMYVLRDNYRISKRRLVLGGTRIGRTGSLLKRSSTEEQYLQWKEEDLHRAQRRSQKLDILMSEMDASEQFKSLTQSLPMKLADHESMQNGSPSPKNGLTALMHAARGGRLAFDLTVCKIDSLLGNRTGQLYSSLMDLEFLDAALGVNDVEGDSSIRDRRRGMLLEEAAAGGNLDVLQDVALEICRVDTPNSHGGAGCPKLLLALESINVRGKCLLTSAINSCNTRMVKWIVELTNRNYRDSKEAWDRLRGHKAEKSSLACAASIPATAKKCGQEMFDMVLRCLRQAAEKMYHADTPEGADPETTKKEYVNALLRDELVVTREPRVRGKISPVSPLGGAVLQSNQVLFQRVYDAYRLYGGRWNRQQILDQLREETIYIGDVPEAYSIANDGGIVTNVPAQMWHTIAKAFEEAYGGDASWDKWRECFSRTVQALAERGDFTQMRALVKAKFPLHAHIPVLLERIGDHEENIIETVMLVVVHASNPLVVWAGASRDTEKAEVDFPMYKIGLRRLRNRLDALMVEVLDHLPHTVRGVGRALHGSHEPSEPILSHAYGDLTQQRKRDRVVGLLGFVVVRWMLEPSLTSDALKDSKNNDPRNILDPLQHALDRGSSCLAFVNSALVLDYLHIKFWSTIPNWTSRNIFHGTIHTAFYAYARPSEKSWLQSCAGELLRFLQGWDRVRGILAPVELATAFPHSTLLPGLQFTLAGIVGNPVTFFVVPAVRFMFEVMSYIAMLGLFCASVTIQESDEIPRHERIFYFFVLGLLWRETLEFQQALPARPDSVLDNGVDESERNETRPTPCHREVLRPRHRVASAISRYLFYDTWNILDTLTIVVVGAAFVFRILALGEGWSAVDERTSAQGADSQNFFFISQFCLSISAPLLFSRVLFLSQIDNTLGPMTQVIWVMMSHLARFTVFLLVVMASFALAFHALFFTCDGVELSSEDALEDEFGTFWRSMLTMFESMLGGFDFDVLLSAHECNRPSWAYEASVWLLVGYEIIMAILLLNLLIAVMATAHSAVDAHAEEEFQLARAKLILQTSRAVANARLPPPFNLIEAAMGFLVDLPHAIWLLCYAVGIFKEYHPTEPLPAGGSTTSVEDNKDDESDASRPAAVARTDRTQNDTPQHEGTVEDTKSRDSPSAGARPTPWESSSRQAHNHGAARFIVAAQVLPVANSPISGGSPMSSTQSDSAFGRVDSAPHVREDEETVANEPFSKSYLWLTIKGGRDRLIFAFTMGLASVIMSMILWIVSTPWIAWRILRWFHPAKKTRTWNGYTWTGGSVIVKIFCWMMISTATLVYCCACALSSAILWLWGLWSVVDWVHWRLTVGFEKFSNRKCRMVVPGEERSDDWQKAREIAKARNYKQNNTDSDQFNVGTLLKMTTGMDLEQLALYVKMKTEADRLKEYVTPSLSRMISPQTLDSIKGDDNGRPEGPFVLRSRSANSSEE